MKMVDDGLSTLNMINTMLSDEDIREVCDIVTKF